MPGQELVEDAAQPIDVGRRADRLEPSLGLLGGHVGRRAERDPALGLRPLAVGEPGQAEVGDPGLEVGQGIVVFPRWLVRVRAALEQDVEGFRSR